ncbi:50S ribosomal protein L10 [Patescibacteria group bacterium]|nr:50S ribosomal protein L10 [Patescibacteria group bacterium]
MAITKHKKHEIVKDLKEGFKKAQVIIFVNFHGLSVSAVSDLRKKLKEVGTNYKVVKKTLIKKTLEDFNFNGEIPELDGEVAIAFSENEPVAPAKIIKDFSKKNSVKLLGGVFENKYIDGKTMIILANIPPKEVLLAQFVNVINSPIQGMVVALNEISTKFVRILSQIKK